MVDEAELAWALGEVAHPYLNIPERNDVYVAIGAGEMFSAIRALITVIVHEGLTLPDDITTTFAMWLDAYVGHDDEPHLRGLIGQVVDQPN